MQPVQAISFDFDETLLDGSRSFQQTVSNTCADLAKPTGLEASQIFDANSKVWESYWPKVEEKWTLGQLSGSEVSLEGWRRTFLECGRDDESFARLALQIHSEHRRRTLRLFDDVQETLSVLKSRVRLAVITNGASDTQRGRLQQLGIERVFDAVVISGELGVAKPDASIFAIALERLRANKETVWHVGDTLKTDVAGALGAGLTAVWLNRSGVSRKERDPRPDHEIRSLKELVPLVIASA